MKKGFFYLCLITAIVSAFAFISVWLPPDISGIVPVFALLIPVFLLINFCLMVLGLFVYPLYSLIPLAALLSGCSHISNTFAFNIEQENQGFKILNYNVRVFNSYDHLRDEDYASSVNMIKWLNDHEADIKCFQEFYNNDSSDIFNSRVSIAEKNPFHVIYPFLDKDGHQFGLAIFSKYPVIRSGELKMNKKTFNQIIFADILFPEDTVRIYNLHLESMHMEEDSLLVRENILTNIPEIIRSLKNGAADRYEQTKILLDHVHSSPYKVIVCGDFNETPYGYVYRRLKADFQNSFEQAGWGLGFTYNGKLFFLRIDHQFADKNITVKRHRVLNHIKYSDHFPIESTYSIQ